MSDRQTKDIEYLSLIAEYRIITTDMLAFLAESKLRTTQHRIKNLTGKKFITLSPHLGNASRGKPSNLISLSYAGIEAIADILEKDDKDPFYRIMNQNIYHIDHELLTNVFRLHLLQLARHNREFTTDFISPKSPFLSCRKNGLPEISEQVTVNGSTRTFIPDGVCSIYSTKEKNRLLFFLESDRANESIRGASESGTLTTKLENYHAYLTSGEYKRYDKYWNCSFSGFRLLFLCDDTSKMKKLARFVAQYPTLDYVWITDTENLVTKGIGERIWLRGGNTSISAQSILGHGNVCTLPPVITI